jgi:hypothetical protein
LHCVVKRNWERWDVVNFGFDQSYTLAEIADRAALPIERLRYAIDSRILPGSRRLKRRAGASNPGRGIPRAFTLGEAFALVMVVKMLEAGIRRRAAQDCLDILSMSIVPNSRHPRDILLTRVLHDGGVVALEIGDGLNIRLVCEGRVHSALPRTWLQPKTGAALANYDPMLLVRINLTKLRALFR